MRSTFSTKYLSEGIRTGAGVNDSPVDCQSRDLARPQAGRIPPSMPLKRYCVNVQYPFY